MKDNKSKIDPERIKHKQSMEWGGVILANGKSARENYEANKNKKKPAPKKK